jgi:hypothetical protein
MAESRESRALEVLKERFGRNMRRHEGIAWDEVEKRIAGDKAALRALAAMEDSGGEPDVVGRDPATGEYLICDCSAESPAGRRSLSYDHAALESRKEHKPDGSAAGTAESMGIELMTERQYRDLQELGEFDLKTSSWVATPDDVRGLGGALFCDRRYGRVFTYHNGADSYYAARGFRGCLRA